MFKSVSLQVTFIDSCIHICTDILNNIFNIPPAQDKCCYKICFNLLQCSVALKPNTC